MAPLHQSLEQASGVLIFLTISLESGSWELFGVANHDSPLCLVFERDQSSKFSALTSLVNDQKLEFRRLDVF